MRRIVDVASKLELTSIALGCLTRKELCAAFARVNANTVMTLQNSYNWQSGRSTPRNFTLFEDWAAVLGLSDGPHFIMSSSLEEFARTLREKFSLPEGLLESFGTPAASASAASAPGTGADPAAPWRNGSLLQGSFLALSLAWSPTQAGRALYGVMTFSIDGGGNLTASYLENILGQAIPFRGGGLEDGKTCQVILQCEANGATFLMAFHLPPLPGNLAGGIFAGNAVYDPNSEPTASGLLLVRNHELSMAELEELAGYEDLSDTALAACLQKLGYGHDPARTAEQELVQLLAAPHAMPLLSVRRDALTRATVLLDRRRLEAAGIP